MTNAAETKRDCDEATCETFELRETGGDVWDHPLRAKTFQITTRRTRVLRFKASGSSLSGPWHFEPPLQNVKQHVMRRPWGWGHAQGTGECHGDLHEESGIPGRSPGFGGGRCLAWWRRWRSSGRRSGLSPVLPLRRRRVHSFALESFVAVPGGVARDRHGHAGRALPLLHQRLGEKGGRA
jgi:hypothetical protein